MTEKVNEAKEEENEVKDAKIYHFPLDYKESTRIATLECLKEKPKYPKDYKVIRERARHIFCKSAPIEPYYIPNGREQIPKVTSEDCGVVTYLNENNTTDESELEIEKSERYFKDGLSFESKFESGNLAKVIKVTPFYYELHLRPDLYINKHVQWFYFRITGMKNRRYRFSIINFGRAVNLYSRGMRPLMYSKIDAEKRLIGWRRCGTHMVYYLSKDDKFSLSFILKFPYENDTVYLAHCYPYTYSDLQGYLFNLMNDPIKSEIILIKQLCRTVAGNNVYDVTITSEPHKKLKNKRKKAIVLTARVHPCETPSSWMMHGIIEFLTSNTEAARELREQYVFKLVPMLNPDGVIVGNSRCSLTGLDLNRQYRSAIRESNPSVWNTRLMIKKMLQDHGVIFYCDLHAHSNRNNCFVFGCQNRRAVFSMLLQRNAPDKFALDNCSFSVDECKEGTGRVSMFSLGITNSYTFEASMGGTDLRNNGLTHFNAWDYVKMGVSFCHALIDLFDPIKEPLRTKMLCMISKGQMLDKVESDSDVEKNEDENK